MSQSSDRMSCRGRRLRGVLVVVLLLTGLLASGTATNAANASDTAGVAGSDPTTQGRRTLTGTIEGADFRVEMPRRWNGTLVLFSHGLYPAESAPWPPEIRLANRTETDQWLLEHGYALAASDYRERYGYSIEPALDDQMALLDWFDANVGQPHRTITMGWSMGAVISVMLAERDPDRFDGVAALCGEFDANGTWNSALDISYAVRTLLAPGADIDLVRASDPAGSNQALAQAVERALTTPEGRARLALAGALGNIPGWYSAHQAEPTELAEKLRQQALWTQWAYVWGMGPNGRTDIERRAGGNPSSNVGVDYRRQLGRSSQRHLIQQAYREAGLDLGADLDRLARGERIAADPEAVGYMYRHGVPHGRTAAPVITLHNTGDGGAVPDQAGWYAAQVRKYGDPAKLRQVYVDRGMHCAFSAAEEIVTLRALFERVDTGRWPDTRPARLNTAAADLGEEYQLVFDIGTGQDAAMPPAFTKFRPPVFLRPSR